MTTYRFEFSVDDDATVISLPARECTDDLTALELAQELMKKVVLAIQSGERQVARVGCDGNNVPAGDQPADVPPSSQFTSKSRVASNR